MFGNNNKQSVNNPEPILPTRRICKLRRALETPGGPLALKADFILVPFEFGQLLWKHES